MFPIVTHDLVPLSSASGSGNLVYPSGNQLVIESPDGQKLDLELFNTLL